MAFTKPYFSLGLPVPNCNFQLPGDTTGLAAGWSVYSGSANIFSNNVGTRVGRQRAQYIQTSGVSTTTIMSAPADPYKLTLPYATKVLGVLDVVDTTTNNTVSLGIGWYDSAGALIGSVATGVSELTPLDGLYITEASVTPPGGAVFARLFLQQYHTQAGYQTTIVYFAGIGCWNANTASYFQPTRFPIHPGTTGRQTTLDAGRYRNEAGIVRTVDRTRHARPNSVTLAFNRMPTTDMILLQDLDGFNTGHNFTLAASANNPGNGSWPILLVPGNTGLVSAMLCDLTSGVALDPDEEWGRQDPPLWQGSLEFVERT